MKLEHFLEQLHETKNRNPGNLNFDGKPLREYTVLNGDLELYDEGLTSLEGCPREITGNFLCDHNMITSLEGAPEKINGYFSCNRNLLTSLKGCPQKTIELLECSNNQLTSLEGCPTVIIGYLFADSNQIKDLHNIHTYLKSCTSILLNSNPIKSHVLGLLKIKNLNEVQIDNQEVQEIINKYLPLGNIFACQSELIEAGYEEFAKL